MQPFANAPPNDRFDHNLSVRAILASRAAVRAALANYVSQVSRENQGRTASRDRLASDAIAETHFPLETFAKAIARTMQMVLSRAC